MTRITRRKTVDISGAPGIYTITFSNDDFSIATGDPTIYPPFSLSMFVENPLTSVLYIGVVLTTPSGRLNVGDRINIAFVAAQNNLLITPATCPALANITEEVIAISVVFYRPGFATHASNFAAAQLYISPAVDHIAPMPLIGRDTIAYNPAIYGVPSSGITTVTAATSENLILEALAIADVRLHIIRAQLRIPPTPYPGDIEGYFKIFQNGVNSVGFGHTFSLTDGFTVATFDNIILNIGDTFRVYANNNNSAIDYDVRAEILYERLI